MSTTYRWVQWNRHKRVYDAVLAALIVGFVAVFVGVHVALTPASERVSEPILVMRALGLAGLVLLHVILCIGPLARLTDRAKPLLYNRRHAGVAFFAVVLAHAVVAIGFYGGFGVRDPVSAVVDGYASTRTFASISGFPFESLGAAALVVFFVMAATSHDFWLANLGHRFWKALHMAVYGAYVLVIGHVALGALQSERSLVYSGALVTGVALVAGLHVLAGLREWRRDRAGVPLAEALEPDATGEGWIDVAAYDEVPEGRAVVVCVGAAARERIAVFKNAGVVHAISNVCAHQGGPLGEGAIIDGCVTCPWHGYQYRVEDGQSPPPFEEKVPTYEVRVRGARVEVHTRALAPGTPTRGGRLVPTTPAEEHAP